ncbi:MAG: hypothetical protein H6838_03520 [Planctomycetes bacterium]|nr:hypothetical protein [Planctomycetota bacterium]
MWRRSAAFVVLGAMLGAQDTKEVAVARDWLGRLEGAQCDQARAALVEMGAAAVPAIMDVLEGADAASQAPYCSLLIEMGSAAVGARARIEALLGDRKKATCELVWVLAEIAGHEVVLDPDSRSPRWVFNVMTTMKGDGQVAFSRLSSRSSMPRDLALEDWIEALASTNAVRVEFATEQLARLGAKAEAALPGLQLLLEVPDPRILGSERTIHLRRKAALAVLAIAPQSPAGDRAREVLAGVPPVIEAPPEVPERAAARVTELARELRHDGKRDEALANLVALGALAVPAFVAALDPEDVETTAAALAGLTRLGRTGAAAAPALYDQLGRLPGSLHPALMRALTAVAPHCREVWCAMSWGSTGSSLTIFGRSLRTEESAVNEFRDEATVFQVAMVTDSGCPIGELEHLLDDRYVPRRERALAELRRRGAAAARSLPEVVAMLDAAQPKLLKSVHVGNTVTSQQVDRDDEVHRLAAEAILAIAPPGDPAIARAKAVLGR